MKYHEGRGVRLGYRDVESEDHTISIPWSELSNSRSLLKKLLKIADNTKYVRESRDDKDNGLVCRLRPSTAHMSFQQLVDDLLSSFTQHVKRTRQASLPRSSRNQGYVNKTNKHVLVPIT